jgi:DNA-binding NarL/FixJ family response regulator
MSYKTLALLEENKKALELFKDGLTTKEVAVKIGMNKRTLDGRISRMILATGKRTITGVVVYALEHKIINLVYG